MSNNFFRLFLMAVTLFLVHCVAKKPAATAVKAAPASDAPVTAAPATDTSPLKAPSVAAETQKMLSIAEGVEHGATQNWLNQGKDVLNVQCAYCHKVKDPLKYDESGWVKHMNRMVPKAKLTEDQAKYLRVYTLTLIRSNAVK